MQQNELEEFLSCVRNLKTTLREQEKNGGKWLISYEPIPLYEEEEKNYIEEMELPPPKPSQIKSAPPPPVSAKIRATSSKDSSLPIHLPSNTSKIVFVRLCPTDKEIASKKPYCDEGGKLLDVIIEKIGWSSDWIYKTYLCKHSLDYFSKDHENVSKIRQSFYDEISCLKSPVIVCWGEQVSQILGESEEDLSELRKKKVQKHSCRLFFLWDPFYFMKKQEIKKHVWNDIKAIDKIIR